MRLSLFPKLTGFTGVFSSKREKPVDIEMGLTSQASATINWSALAANPALTERIMQAPPAPGEVRQFATFPAPSKAAVLKSKYLLLLAVPAVFGATYGVAATVGTHQVAQYAGCRTSACQGFGDASWDMVSWKNHFPEVVGTGHGNLTQACLDNFENAIVRDDSNIVFNRFGDLCAHPAFSSVNEKVKLSSVITGVSAAVVGVTIFAMAKREQKSQITSGLRSAQQILFPDLLRALNQGGIEASQHLHANLTTTLGEQLVQAAARGDNTTVEQLLAIGVSALANGASNTSALVTALTYHQQEAALTLSGALSDVSPADVTAAARSANVVVFLRLLTAARSQGAAHYTNFLSQLDGALLSSFAVAQTLPAPGLAGILEALQPETQRLMDHQDDQGRTALHLAMYWQRADQAKALLHAGANTSLLDTFGRSVASAVALGSNKLAA